MTSLSEDEELALALALSASEAEAKRAGHDVAVTSSSTGGRTPARPQAPQQAPPLGGSWPGDESRRAARPQALQPARPLSRGSAGGGGLGEQFGRLAEQFKRLLNPGSDAVQRPQEQQQQPQRQPSWLPVGMPVVRAGGGGGGQQHFSPSASAGPMLASDEALARALQEQFDREQQQQQQQDPGQAAPVLQYHSYPPRPGPGYPGVPYGSPYPGTFSGSPPLPEPGELPAMPNHPGVKPAPSPRPPAAAAATARPGTCAGCGQALPSLSSMLGGGYVSALGRSWHPVCFKCTGCGGVLTSGRLGARVEFIVGNDQQPYHPTCHKRMHHPRCRVCDNFVPSEGGRIQWTEAPFWRDKYCPCHTSDGTHRCTGCNRYQPRGEQWADLDDGRKLCLECLNTLVADTADAQPLYDNILNFYAGLGMRLPLRPPMMLVESGALNQAEQREGRDHESGPVFHTRGLCLTEEWTSFTSVVRVPRGAGVLLGGLLGGGSGGSYSLAPHTVQLGPTRTEVTAILVLYGLPWLLTGSILVHECMHAWLRLSGYRGLAPQVEEGMCQLMALLWLEAQPQPKGSYEERLASYLAHQIRTDPSAVYGDGFRAALEAFQRFGLQSVLAHLRQTGQLPC